MRSALLLSLPLLAATVGACSQALTPNMTGTGGIMTGTGDVTGSGGFVTGAGGTGGVVTGSGGTGGSNVAMCNTLEAEYASANAAAQSCQVGASGQCQQVVSGGLYGCGCPTYVNDSTVLAEVASAYQMAGCAANDGPCDLPCPAPINTTCVSTDGGTTGSCSYLPGTGGITGSGGSPLDGGAADPCDTFAAEYAAVLKGASSCTAGAAAQCEQPVPAALAPCNTACTVYVNDASVLNVIRQQWDAARCGSVAVDCPLVSCPFVAGGACVASDAGGSACSTRYGQITTG